MFKTNNEEEMIEALKAANAWTFIDKKDRLKKHASLN
jgi:hypothetical protein